MRSNRKRAELATYMIVGVIVLSLILLRMTGQMLFGWIAVVSPFVWLIFELIFDRCPHCGKFLGRQIQKYCHHCGEKLED